MIASAPAWIEAVPGWVRVANAGHLLGHTYRSQELTLPLERPAFLSDFPDSVPRFGFDVDGDESILCQVRDDGSFLGVSVAWYGFDDRDQDGEGRRYLVRATDEQTARRIATYEQRGLFMRDGVKVYESPRFTLVRSC